MWTKKELVIRKETPRFITVISANWSFAILIEELHQIYLSSVFKLKKRKKKNQLKQITDKVHLALGRCKTDGKKKKNTESEMLDSNCVNNLVRLYEGYYI